METVAGPILPPELTLTSDPSLPWAACFPLFGRLRRDASVEGLIGTAKVHTLDEYMIPHSLGVRYTCLANLVYLSIYTSQGPSSHQSQIWLSEFMHLTGIL